MSKQAVQSGARIFMLHAISATNNTAQSVKQEVNGTEALTGSPCALSLVSGLDQIS